MQGWTLQLQHNAWPFDIQKGQLDINKLQQWVQEACQKTNTELLIILKQKYFYAEHCLYFKKYLLMG